MEVGDRLWTAGASDSDLSLLAIFFYSILFNIKVKKFIKRQNCRECRCRS